MVQGWRFSNRITKLTQIQLSDRLNAVSLHHSELAYISEGTPVIGINALHHPNGQRYSIAHEVAHPVLQRPLISGKVHVDPDRLCASANASERGAGLRLGQSHRPEAAPIEHWLQPKEALLGRCKGRNEIRGGLGQHRIS